MTVADQFQDAMEKLADDTARTARRIANRRNISKAERAIRLAALINTSNARAVALGEAFTIRQLEDVTGKPVAATGVLPADDSERLLDAARKIMSDKTPLERVERLARGEAASAAQSAATDALSSQKPPRGGFTGWRRQLDANACPRCRRWAGKGGRVFPADHRFARHPNCLCVPVVVITTTPPKPVRNRRRRT